MNERGLLVDCLRRLNRTSVVYYLTGSMASNYWGVPRSTHDLDFVVQLPMPAVIATAEDVILHKLIWNRLSPSERQLGDAAGVVVVQADALDKNYLRQWSNELGVAGELERLL